MLLTRVGSIIFLLLPCFASAQDTLYTMPINKARMLVRDAIKSQIQDSVIVLQASRIDSLHLEKMIMAKSYTFLVASKDQQIQALKGVNDNLNAMIEIKNKDLRRARRGGKILKGFAITGTIGGMFLGSKL